MGTHSCYFYLEESHGQRGRQAIVRSVAKESDIQSDLLRHIQSKFACMLGWKVGAGVTYS